MTTIVSLRTLLPLPALPSELHGRQVLGIGVCHVGDHASAERDIAPLRALGSPIFDNVGPKPFATHQRAFDATVPWDHGYYWKSLNLPDLSDDAIDILVEPRMARRQAVVVHHRVPARRGRFGDRCRCLGLPGPRSWLHGQSERRVAPRDHARGQWKRIAWARATYAALEPLSTGASYVNFMMAEGTDTVRRIYGPAYDRLAAIKARYDPDNVLAANQNIRPLVTAPRAAASPARRSRSRVSRS